MKKLLLLLTLLGSTANACNLDTDCSPGSKCLKRNHAIAGICAGGINPGNRYDQRPVKDYAGTKAGNTCIFNTSCSVGQSCLKSRGAINGVCR